MNVFIFQLEVFLQQIQYKPTNVPLAAQIQIIKKKNGDEESEIGKSQNEYTWSNILRRYKGRSSNLTHLNLYKFVALHFYNDQIIHPQFFGYNKSINYPPTESFSKIMLTIYKPWKNSIEEI